MEKINTRISLALLALLAVAVSCTQETKKVAVETIKATSLIIPPIESVNVDFLTYQVDADNGTEISLDNGTEIKVPANCFVDADGNQVKGEVELKYREFHNASHILASGIPMKYDTADFTMDFQTAGMFEIDAFTANGPVYIANDKSIEVNMASYANDGDYNFYYLDEEDENWSYLSANTPTPNMAKQARLKELEQPVASPVQPEAYDPSKYTFDLNVEYRKFPELKAFNGIMWQFAGVDPQQDPQNFPELKKQEWKTVNLKPIKGEEGKYTLAVSNKDMEFETVVKPVLRGKALEKSDKEFAGLLASYNRKMELIEAEKERLKDQADLMRSFSVKQMGIYNYDRQLKYPNRCDIIADFDFGNEVDKDVNYMSVYLITGGGRSVVHYPPHDWGRFAFSPEDENSLVAILPGGKLAVFTKEQFKQLDVERFRKSGEPTHFTFKMTPTEVEVASVDDLSKAIGI